MLLLILLKLKLADSLQVITGIELWLVVFADSMKKLTILDTDSPTSRLWFSPTIISVVFNQCSEWSS